MRKSLTEKERKILKHLHGQRTSYNDLPGEVGMTRRQAAGVLNSLRRKGLVEGGLLKYTPVRDAVVWQLTGEGKKVFVLPTPDDMYKAHQVGLVDELRDAGMSNPQAYLQRYGHSSLSLVFFFRAIRKQFPYLTIKGFHDVLRRGYENSANWGGYRFHLHTGLPMSNIVGYPSVTVKEFKDVSTFDNWVQWRFVSMWKLEESERE